MVEGDPLKLRDRAWREIRTRDMELARHTSGESYRTVVGQRNEWIAKAMALQFENTGLRPVVEAARALLRTNGDEPEWAALRVALYEKEARDGG